MLNQKLNKHIEKHVFGLFQGINLLNSNPNTRKIFLYIFHDRLYSKHSVVTTVFVLCILPKKYKRPDVFGAHYLLLLRQK
jgi:hypothetical protein